VLVRLRRVFLLSRQRFEKLIPFPIREEGSDRKIPRYNASMDLGMNLFTKEADGVLSQLPFVPIAQVGRGVRIIWKDAALVLLCLSYPKSWRCRLVYGYRRDKLSPSS
jgi:hypothetical protein